MLNLKIFPVTDFQTNSIVLSCPETREAVIVDPGGGVDKIQSYLTKESLCPTAIWLTHSHLDHCGGVRMLKERISDLVLYGHKLGKELRENVVTIAKMYDLGMGDMENSPEPDVYLEDNQELQVGKNKFITLFTPGHSVGHICFYSEENSLLLTGDALFAGSIGRTDLPGGNYEQLIHSIKSRMLVLPDDTKVIAGHGPETTIVIERETNPFLLGVVNG